MNGGSYGQEQLQLVNGSREVSVEAQAEDFEEYLEIVEDGEADLQPLLMLEEVLAGLLIWSVLEADTSGDDGVGDGDNDNNDVVDGGSEESLAKPGRPTRVPIFVDSHQLPGLVISLQNLSTRLT